MTKRLTALILTFAAGPMAFGGPSLERSQAYDQAIRAKETFPKSLLAEIPFNSVDLREQDGRHALVVTVPDQEAKDLASEQLPKVWRGIPIEIENTLPLVRGDSEADRLAALLTAAVIKTECEKLISQHRPSQIGLSKCDPSTGELNNGARGTKTVACLSIYAPSEQARQALFNHFGNERDGIMLIYKLSSAEPFHAFGAGEAEAKPTEAEALAVQDAIMNDVFEAVPLTSLSLGPGGDGIAVILDAPDREGAEKLLEKYPAGTRIQNVPIVVQVSGVMDATDPVVRVDDEPVQVVASASDTPIFGVDCDGLLTKWRRRATGWLKRPFK